MPSTSLKPPNPPPYAPRDFHWLEPASRPCNNLRIFKAVLISMTNVPVVSKARGGEGGDPSVLDANYPPPTNCWLEAPWGGGGGGSGRGAGEGASGGGRFPGGGGGSGTSKQLGMRPTCDPTTRTPTATSCRG